MHFPLVLSCLCLLPSAVSAAEPPPQETVADLIKKLHHDSPPIRVHAAHQLGDMGLAAREAVSPLGQLLQHDPSPLVRERAAKSLACIGAPAVPVLMEALKDPTAKNRALAATALAWIGPPAKAAVPALIELLNDKQEAVRRQTIMALEEIGPDSQPAASALVRLLGTNDNRMLELIALTLDRIGPPSIPALREALRTETASIRLGTLYAIGLFGPGAKETVPELREALTDSDVRIRAAAAAALGAMGEEAKVAVPELLKLLEDKKIAVQMQAANTLVNLAALGVPGVFEKIKEADRKGSWAAPFIIEKFGPQAQKAIASLLKDLRSKEAAVREQAATALGALGDQAKAAVAALTRALQDEDANVRAAAAFALTQIDKKKARERVIRDLLFDTEKDPHFPGLNMQLLPAEAVRQAMKDPAIQAAFNRFLRDYVAVILATDHIPGMPSQERREADRQLDSLGPEAVPALVTQINNIVRWRLGFC